MRLLSCLAARSYPRVSATSVRGPATASLVGSDYPYSADEGGVVGFCVARSKAGLRDSKVTSVVEAELLDDP